MAAVPPRHLAPRRRGLGSPRRLLAMGGAVVVLAAGAVTIAVAAGGGQPADRGAAVSGPPPSAAPAPRTSPSSSRPAPRTSSTQPVRALPGNLLANGDFERGLNGWGALGGARMDRVAVAHSGAWAVRVSPATGGVAERPGIAVPLAAAAPQGRTYEGSAWVRASRPGTEATLALREYAAGGQPSADVIGVTLQDSQWHEVAVVHRVHLAGARLALELTGGISARATSSWSTTWASDRPDASPPASAIWFGRAWRGCPTTGIGGGGIMHWPLRCLVVVAAPAVLALASLPSASAETFLGLRNVDCNGVTVSGAGLPANAVVTVTLTDSQQRALERQPLTTSANGAFIWSTRVSLSGLRSVRAVVTRAGASVPVAWTEHSVPAPCPLVNTGADHAVPLVGLALSSIVLGFLLLTAVSYKGNIRGYQGRHVAVR